MGKHAPLDSCLAILAWYNGFYRWVYAKDNMGIHRYKQTPMRFTERDRQRIETIKQKWNVERDIAAVRIALYELAKQNMRPTPSIRDMVLKGL
jgi:hypothetical protein